MINQSYWRKIAEKSAKYEEKSFVPYYWETGKPVRTIVPRTYGIIEVFHPSAEERKAFGINKSRICLFENAKGRVFEVNSEEAKEIKEAQSYISW